MRRLLRRSSLQPRFAPCLESLEDRRLLSGLLALGVGNTSHASSPSALTDLIAAPMTLLSPVTTTVQSLGAVVPTALLSPVTTTVQNLGGTVLDGLAPGVASPPATASAPASGLDLNLNLNVDVLFVHLDQVHLNVSLAPVDSSQPLVSLGVGGTVALGGQAGGLLNIAPEVSLGLGGSSVASLGVGSSGSVLSPPDLPVVGPIVGDLGGAVQGSSPIEGGAGVPVIPTVPPNGVETPAPANTAPGVGSILGDLGGATQGNSPTEGGAAVSVTPSVTPAVNVVAPANATEEPASALAAALGGASSSSGTAAVLAAPGQGIPDGGGGSTGTADAPLESARLVDNGGAGDPVAAPPVPQADGGGGEVNAAAADLAPEGSGLATRFQPDGVGRLSPVIAAMSAAPQGGWLAALLGRFAPYLAALIAAGVGFDLERRRRLRRAAKAAGPRP